MYIYSSKYIACRQKQICLQTEKKILTFFDINITKHFNTVILL